MAATRASPGWHSLGISSWAKGEWDALQSFLYDPGAKGNKDPLIATKTGVDLESISVGVLGIFLLPPPEFIAVIAVLNSLQPANQVEHTLD
ncbi:MAG: hypothetical protein VKM97_04530 [Cyanobacteriota bacterium]|nr:hypothetical protein [Cyanobacteriota bacterium]